MNRQIELKQNIDGIVQRIQHAAKGRSVRLVAVSKTRPSTDIKHLYDLGYRHFGENIKEMVDKSKELPNDINWHFIGNVQSNKIKTLLEVPNLYILETLDSIKKADLLNKACAIRTTPLRVLIQVNTSGEEAKNGVPPSYAVELAEHIQNKCPNLLFCGLMTIGSRDASLSEGINPDFSCLVSTKQEIQEKLGIVDLELSMGMSSDFELAIAQGSTNIRVGSDIFGARDYSTTR